MEFLVYLVFLMVFERGNGVKFSAESFAEISLLAEKGKSHLEHLKKNANVPQYGPCWKNAISNLQIGCKFLSENVQSDLALRFTDCFLQMSGHEPLNCDSSKNICLKQLSDRAFNAYTEFYTHTQSICYFLQSQVWHEETEKTIDKLQLTSLEVSEKLEEAGEIQEKLLSEQKKSLSLQHDLYDNSKNIASTLKLSQEKINVFIKDFEVAAAEQKNLLGEVFENLLLFKSWAENELSWINSTVYFATAALISFIITSVRRTRDARMILLIIFALNYLFERLLTSSSVFQTNLGTTESLNFWIWLCRKFCISLSFFMLLYTAFSYYDYNILNYQLLIEIKKQNMLILDHFAKLSQNQNNKTNFPKINNISNQFYSTPSQENYKVILNNGSVTKPWSRDLVDCTENEVTEETKPVESNNVDSAEEEEYTLNRLKHKYSLRSYKRNSLMV